VGEGLQDYVDSSDILRTIVSKLDKTNEVFVEDFEVYAPKPQFVGKVGKPYYRVLKGDWPEFCKKLESIIATTEFKKWEKVFQSCKDYIELAIIYDWIFRRNNILKEIITGTKKLDFKLIENYLHSKELKLSPELLAIIRS
jgi:hypothetical protein